ERRAFVTVGIGSRQCDRADDRRVIAAADRDRAQARGDGVGAVRDASLAVGSGGRTESHRLVLNRDRAVAYANTGNAADIGEIADRGGIKVACIRAAAKGESTAPVVVAAAGGRRRANGDVAAENCLGVVADCGRLLAIGIGAVADGERAGPAGIGSNTDRNGTDAALSVVNSA